jgi:NAD(P)-dependent dehydrogenase (short-subunit alcohol dehydrogenase family)
VQLEEFGPIDVFVYNTGIFKLEDSVWLDYYQTNVMSMVRLCRARNQGSIINIASASEGGVQPLSQMIYYSMKKSANRSISHGLAELTKGTHVRVNSPLAGPTWTDRAASYFEGLVKPAAKPVDE